MTFRRSRRWAASLTAGGGLLLTAVALAPPVSAHAVLEETAPTPEAVLKVAPPEVRLQFSEAVNAELGGVKVFAPDGSRVDRGRVELGRGGRELVVPVDGRRRGTYTVAWAVVSEDSHNISGSFVYSVRRVSGGADVGSGDDHLARVAADVSRWAALAGTLLLFGGLVFWWLVAGAFSHDGLLPRRLRRVLLAAAALAFVGASVNLVAQVAIASGRSVGGALTVVPDAVSGTRFGALAALRAVLAIPAVILPMVRSRRLAGPVVGALALLSLGLITVPSVAGHSWTVTPRWLSVPVDVLHFGAASVWVGGLAALAVVAPGSDRAKEMLKRFSRLALLAVAVVFFTGSVSAWFQVRSVAALTQTDYGMLFMLKIGAVAALVGLGWLNRARLIRRLPARDTVLKMVRLETAIAFVVVVGLTSVLVSRPPARTDLVRPFSAVLELEDDPARGQVQVQVQPRRTGSNDIHMYFLNEAGAQGRADAVEVTAGRKGVPPRKLRVTPVTPDHFSAYAASFPSPGVWTVEVTAVRDGQTMTATTDVQIR